jgi:hypothetical protein
MAIELCILRWFSTLFPQARGAGKKKGKIHNAILCKQEIVLR